MTEMCNISELCRCCHSEGDFKSLQLTYTYKTRNEIYGTMLADTFGITLSVPDVPSVKASNSICDECIADLRAASRFRQQVLDCEQKFLMYIKGEVCNEFQNNMVQITEMKLEFDEEYSNKLLANAIKQEPKEPTNDDDDGDGFADQDGDTHPEDDCGQTHTDKVLPENSNRSPDCKPSTTKETTKREKRENFSFSGTRRVFFDPRYTCRECSAHHATFQELLAHFGVHKTTNYVCDICSLEVTGLSVFYRHLSKHQEYRDDAYINMIVEKRFECEICGAKFKSKSSLRKHIHRHLGLHKQFVCETCGLTCNDAANLKAHISTVHEKLRAFPCDVCHKKLSTQKALKAHKLRHSGIKPWQCRSCPERFYERHDRNVHEKKEHEIGIVEVNPGVYKCPQCEETFQTNKACEKHIRSLHGGVACTRNKKVHEGLECNICDKVFYNRFCYNRHQEVHSEVRVKLPCNECDAVLSSKASLYKHKRSKHDPGLNGTGKERVKCPQCKVWVYDLEKHNKVHTYRPHACSYCDKTYPARNALLRHERDHFSAGFGCDRCGKIFKRKRGLERHVQSAHRAVKAWKVGKAKEESEWTSEDEQK